LLLWRCDADSVVDFELKKKHICVVRGKPGILKPRAHTLPADSVYYETGHTALYIEPTIFLCDI